jgi:hypothetical protein
MYAVQLLPPAITLKDVAEYVVKILPPASVFVAVATFFYREWSEKRRRKKDNARKLNAIKSLLILDCITAQPSVASMLSLVAQIARETETQYPRVDVKDDGKGEIFVEIWRDDGTGHKREVKLLLRKWMFERVIMDSATLDDVLFDRVVKASHAMTAFDEIVAHFKARLFPNIAPKMPYLGQFSANTLKELMGIYGALGELYETCTGQKFAPVETLTSGD